MDDGVVAGPHAFVVFLKESVDAFIEASSVIVGWECHCSGMGRMKSNFRGLYAVSPPHVTCQVISKRTHWRSRSTSRLLVITKWVNVVRTKKNARFLEAFECENKGTFTGVASSHKHDVAKRIPFQFLSSLTPYYALRFLLSIVSMIVSEGIPRIARKFR